MRNGFAVIGLSEALGPTKLNGPFVWKFTREDLRQLLKWCPPPSAARLAA